MSEPRRFHIRTFGCQMNEHDSERIAGLLGERGMEPTDDVEHADVVVLNTCCIRENADNKLYGHLGRLKALKEARPDLQIAVGGCLAQKDRELVVERAGHVDVVFGTHNLAHAPALLERARLEGQGRRHPIVEILEEHEAYPSALPARRDVDHSAWVTIQIGCDNSCTFCIVPAVRGKEISRRLGDIVYEVEQLVADGVSEITLLGQNVNSYGRDLGAGQY
ncbi:MAG: radical SAM protein, partial [Acidimicrobiia bacterium]